MSISQNLNYYTLAFHCQPAWRLVPGQDVCNQARFEDAVGIFPEFIDGNLFDLQKVVGWLGLRNTQSLSEVKAV